MSGKKVLAYFFGLMGLFAATGLGIVMYIRAMAPDELEQRKLAVQLSLAYQKYQVDFKEWPKDAKDAAYNFKTENDQLAPHLKKAKDEWGLKTDLVQKGDLPHLVIKFEKPRPLELSYELRIKK